MMWALLLVLAFSSLTEQQAANQCPTVTNVHPKSGLYGQVYTVTGSNLDLVSHVNASNGYGVVITEQGESELRFRFQVHSGNNEVITFNLSTNSSVNCTSIPLEIHIYGISPVVSMVSSDDGQPGTVIRAGGCFPPVCGDNSTSYTIKVGGILVELLPQALTGSTYNSAFYIRLVSINDSIPDASIVLVSGYGTEYTLAGRIINYRKNATLISSITPSSGQTGTNVRITGTDLIGLGGLNIALQSVSIGGTLAEVIDSSQTEINIKVSSDTGVGTQDIVISSIQTSTDNNAVLSGPSTNITGMWTQLEDGVITSLVPPAAQTNATVYACGMRLLGGGSNISNVNIDGIESLNFSIGLDNLSNPSLPSECIRFIVPENTTGGFISITSNTGAIVSTKTDLFLSYANITSVSPNRGQEYTYVTLNGSNVLSGYNSSDNITELSVECGGIPASVLSYESDSVHVRVNPTNLINALSNIQITVTNYGLTFTVSIPNAWTYLIPGQVDVVTPSFGQYGTRLEITGTNLTGYGQSVQSVRILGSQTGNISVDPYVEFQVISSSESLVLLSVPQPFNASYTGFVDIVLVSDNGALVTGSEVFEYREMGRIDSVNPSQGQRGTYVNITGFQLFGYGSNASTVRFGGIEAAIDYTTSSPSFISVRIGSNSNLTNSTNVTISIISDTHAIVQSSSNWTYLKEGVIDSVTPSRGQFGSLVTINGSNLLGGGISIAQIYIDGVPPNIVSFNEDQIIVTLGDHTSRTDGIPSGEVYIESNTGAIIRGGTFEQLLPGNITSFSPLSGRLGTIVTIHGFNLKGYGSAITNVTVAGYAALSESFETDSSESTLVISIDTAPNGTTGPIHIHIDTGAVIESSESFTYTEPGSISTVSPSTGSEGVGLLITGSLLEIGSDGPAITNVTIGGSEVLRIVTSSPNQVTVIAGPAPIIGNSLLVRVISSDGSYVEGGNSFTYQNLSLSIVGRNTGQYGTQVTLNAPFPATEVASVYFDNQEATIITTQQIDSNSSTVAVTTPRPQRLGQFTVDVSVENNRHIFARLVNGFTYLPEGAIYTVSPSFGQRGTIITLTGERLQGGGDSVVTVDIGGVAATISNYSDSYVNVSLSGNLPNGQSSFSDITIISNTGATITRLDGFMFIEPGQITSISPLSGQHGTIVTLRGTGLLQGNMDIISITVAGNEAQLMDSPNDTYVVVQLMHGMEETGSVIITLDSGAQISSNGLQFSYITAGNISSVSPPVGTVGTIVSIVGTNLRGGGMEAAVVKLNGVPATIISETDTLITVEASIANVSSGGVEIISNTGSIVSGENSWTYEELGNITTVYPQSGQQGVSVTIEGLNLIGSSGSGIIEVTLAGIPATIVSQTNATVQVIAGYSNSSISGPIVMREATGPIIISSFNWLYYEAELVSISPSTGVNGTYILLNGTNIIGRTRQSLYCLRCKFWLHTSL
ncbi:PREDICTED: uncharacterized protein LOC109580202 [Amphimedon queenslandica]|uniref:IPT/TIG domain-containing protein n=1 Tax=Amphimedon queenslandica TaxID=400682 RepID=A0AAN0IW67_AMPQE|nr:PREDICTED: uncharacterized protein LOC109580202 [Amphimedon queenslandica]|eukprot:XP_019848673.1 PREDICTED: uncharacterized protein LOC109580202 [Amphimedon queenslandica]